MKNFEEINEKKKSSIINLNNNFFNKYNSSLISALRGKERQKIPYSIKPFSCIIPRDLNLKRIFIQLFDSSILFYDNNKIYFILSSEALLNRKYIIESIKKFIISNRIEYKLLYNIIYMLDILFYYNNKNKLVSNIEKLGLGATILMVKFIHEEYNVIPLNKFQAFYDDKIYTIKQLQEIEIKCLKLIDYSIFFHGITFIKRSHI